MTIKKTFFVSLLFILIVSSCSKNSSTDNADINNMPLGKSANSFLSSAIYKQLNIEIQYAPGMQPQSQTIDNLTAFLSTYLNKPDGINVILKQVSSINKSIITVDDASAFEKVNRTELTAANKIAAYIYMADADYTTANVLGVAYKNTSIVVLEKTIQKFTGGIGQPSRVKIESGTLEHEFGHLLGLVNIGTPLTTNHEDDAHKGHCNNSNCLMYYLIQTSGMMSALNNNVPTLDVNCINDLKANGGR